MNKILKNIDFNSTDEDLVELKNKTKVTLKLLKYNLNKLRINAEIFLGGSYAKGTMVKKDSYDVDIFVRINRNNFDKDIKKIQEAVEKTAKSIQSKLIVMHGSRDYYQIELKGSKIVFEIIPVLKIKNAEEAENVTDLSYFHVGYMKKKLNKNMQREVRVAKAFLDACNCYGAESYIQGFSGYAVECLIAKYNKFELMLKALTKEGKIIVDPARYYKKTKESLLVLNEAKLQSPIIIIDPTWKKRNALASLSQETYERFRQHAISYLKNPSVKYFEKKKISKIELQEKAKKTNCEFVEIELKTDRQEGDIAGTKMKKAARFILENLKKNYKVLQNEFIYDLNKNAKMYVIAKVIKEINVQGPPIKMTEHALAFKKEHPNSFEKKGKLYCIIKNEMSLRDYLENRILNGKELKSMGIIEAKVILS